MVTTFHPISGPIWPAATYLSSMAGSSRSPITSAISPPSISIPAAISRSTSYSPIRATSRPQACMNHWASPRWIRPSASPSRSTSAAKLAFPASTPPATSPTPSWPRSPRHHRTARWRASSPSSRCWFESTDSLLRFAESFESLSEGLQNALWELGGVPRRHRTDRLTAAVNSDPESELFTRRYQGLLVHYGLEGQAIQPRQANENGDVEQSHHRFKQAVDQALMLRGSRDFADRGDYQAFLKRLMAGRNANRRERFHEEMAVLSSLPARRLEMARRLKARVDSGSTIHVGGNTYSLPSRLIGEQVDVHVGAETIDVWHGAKKLDTLPRLRGRGQHRIEYRHVIDWLVRKPGAFEEYRYRDSMFPTSRFRMAYDLLKDRRPGRVVKDYLAVLLLATREGEGRVDEALRLLLDKGRSPDTD